MWFTPWKGGALVPTKSTQSGTQSQILAYSRPDFEGVGGGLRISQGKKTCYLDSKQLDNAIEEISYPLILEFLDKWTKNMSDEMSDFENYFSRSDFRVEGRGVVKKLRQHRVPLCLNNVPTEFWAICSSGVTALS